MFSILCIVPIYLFYFSWVQRFLFIKELELMTVVRCSDHCKIKGAFGVFPTAQCLLQFDSDILPTLCSFVVLVCQRSVLFLLTSEGIILCSESTEPTFHLHFQASSSGIWRRSSELLSSEPWTLGLQIFKSSTQRTLIQSFQSSESSEHEKSHRLQGLSPFIRTSGLRTSRQCLWASCLSRQSVTLSRVRA